MLLANSSQERSLVNHAGTVLFIIFQTYRTKHLYKHLCCRRSDQSAQGYALTRLVGLLAQMIECPGATTRFAKKGLLGQALLALAGLTAVEVARTPLTGKLPLACFIRLLSFLREIG